MPFPPHTHTYTVDCEADYSTRRGRAERHLRARAVVVHDQAPPPQGARARAVPLRPVARDVEHAGRVAVAAADEAVHVPDAVGGAVGAARAHVAIAPSVYTLVAIHASSSTPHPNAHARATTTSWRRYFRDDGIARRVARPPRAARDDENDEEEDDDDDIAREVVGIDGIARVNMSVARALE